MSERYSRLFALSENLYATGSPVVIAAGALLKDNQTGKVIAQLKLRNIRGKAIKAVKILLSPFDTVGAPLGEAVRHQYLDLNIQRENEFGSNIPIPLPDNTTRSFAVAATEVAFTDNSVWTGSQEAWEALPTPSSINSISETELVKQFRLKYGNRSRSIPLCEKDLWYCTCGALNHQEENQCHVCGNSFADIAAYSEARLTEEMNQRLAAEKAKAEQEALAARLKAEQKALAVRLKAEKITRKAKELVKKAAKPALITAAIVACLLLTIHVIIPAVKYAQADKLVKSGQYDQAIEAYSAMEASKKRDDRIAAAHYTQAEALLAREEYQQAVDKFKMAGNYMDAKTRISATFYAYAESLLADGEYEQAVTQFKNAHSYEDAEERIQAVYYVYAESLFANGEYEQAVTQYKNAGSFEDAEERIQAVYYAYAESLFADGEYTQAASQFENAGDYQDAGERIQASYYALAEDLLSRELFDQAIAQFEDLGDYKDAAERVKNAKYVSAEALIAEQQRYKAYQVFKTLNDYQDAQERAAQLMKELEEAISVRFVYFNTDKNNTTKLSTAYSSTSTGFDYIHYGFLVEGLYPDETIELIQTYTDPGREEILSTWTWKDVTSSQTVEHAWEKGHNFGSYGTFQMEIHIFDGQQNISDADTPIGNFSFKLEKYKAAKEPNLWAGLVATSSGYGSLW